MAGKNYTYAAARIYCFHRQFKEVCYTDGVNGGWTALSGNNYIGSSGSYVVYGLENSLSYVVQD